MTANQLVDAWSLLRKSMRSVGQSKKRHLHVELLISNLMKFQQTLNVLKHGLEMLYITVSHACKLRIQNGLFCAFLSN